MFVHSQVGEDSVELVCSVHAHPRPAVAWVRRGQGELSSSGRVKLENIGSRHTLTIAQVRAEDFGEYECRVSGDMYVFSVTLHNIFLGNKQPGQPAGSD